MKTTLILSIALVSICMTANAQTKYYQTETTYTVGNTTLKVTFDDEEDGDLGFVTLHDINARFVNADQAGRNGGPMPYDYVMGYVPAFTSGAEMFPKANNIIGESLSAQSKQLIGEEEVIIELTYDSQTGRVSDVYIILEKDSPFAFVTPAEYNTMINRLKREIYVEMTNVGRTLNFATTLLLWGLNDMTANPPRPLSAEDSTHNDHSILDEEMN